MCIFYVLLFLDKSDEQKIKKFFTTFYDVPKNKIKKDLHITLYHSRRNLINEVPISTSVSINCNIDETRFMTMTPGGENPREGIIPTQKSIGIRLTKRNEGIDRIISLRREIIKYEPKFNNRKQSTDWTSAFGARHFQPHISLLRPNNNLPNDLGKVGEKFRSEFSQIKFSQIKFFKKKFFKKV